LIDIAKIDKIEKEFSILTKRNDKEEHKVGRERESEKKGTKDEMRESRLLLLRNITPLPARKQNANLLSSLVEYNNKPNKKITIPSSNISISPSKQKRQLTVFL
jgi:hypothetical protein